MNRIAATALASLIAAATSSIIVTTPANAGINICINHKHVGSGRGPTKSSAGIAARAKWRFVVAKHGHVNKIIWSKAKERGTKCWKKWYGYKCKARGKPCPPYTVIKGTGSSSSALDTRRNERVPSRRGTPTRRGRADVVDHRQGQTAPLRRGRANEVVLSRRGTPPARNRIDVRDHRSGPVTLPPRVDVRDHRVIKQTAPRRGRAQVQDHRGRKVTPPRRGRAQVNDHRITRQTAPRRKCAFDRKKRSKAEMLRRQNCRNAKAQRSSGLTLPRRGRADVRDHR